MGKLQPFPLGISKFNKTCGIGKRTHQDTIGKNLRLRGIKISELHHPLGISKFNKTCGIRKRTHQDTRGKNLRLRGIEILELHQVEIVSFKLV